MSEVSQGLSGQIPGYYAAHSHVPQSLGVDERAPLEATVHFTTLVVILVVCTVDVNIQNVSIYIVCDVVHYITRPLCHAIPR